jgi:hypothetical protein
VNDWQTLFDGTRHVTAPALLTVARLRSALADGTVTEDQVSAALAAGEDSIAELLESADDAGGHRAGQVEEFIESFGILELAE